MPPAQFYPLSCRSLEGKDVHSSVLWWADTVGTEGPADRAVALRARKLLGHLTYIPRRGMGQPGIHKTCA